MDAKEVRKYFKYDEVIGELIWTNSKRKSIKSTLTNPV